MEWSAEDVLKMIGIYRQYPCLWEFWNPDYKRVDLKKHAWKQIAKKMGKSMEEVKKKMKYLRSTYVGQKKRAEESKSSASASDDVYKPNLFYYNEFNFLDSVVVLRRAPSSLPKESFEKFEFSPEVPIDYSPESSPKDSCFSRMPISTPVEYKCWRGMKRAKTERNEKFNEALDAIIAEEEKSSAEETMFTLFGKSMKRAKTERNEKFNEALDAIIAEGEKSSAEETMFTLFGKSISMQLDQLPLAVATNKMVEIQKLLADAINDVNKRSTVLEANMFDDDIS